MEITFPVDYDGGPRGQPSRVFRGSGLLHVQETVDGRVFVFTGPRRERSANGQVYEVIFQEKEIWNVVREGRNLEFTVADAADGSGRRSRGAFWFSCPGEADAVEVQAALPTRKDADFLANEDFDARLARLPRARTPWASITYLLIAANVVVFLVLAAMGGNALQPDQVPLHGANIGVLTVRGQWWRLGTCMFVHAGLLHLFLNMVVLWQSGPLVERLLGRGLFALTYLGAGLLASMASLLWNGLHTYSVGASGAVFGVCGALMGYLLRYRHALPRAVWMPILKSTGKFALYNIAFGIVVMRVVRIDNAAHVGGLLGGMILGAVVALPVDLEARAGKSGGRFVAGLVTLAGLLLIGASFALKMK